MDRRKFYFDHVVDDGDLNGLQDAIEAAIGRVVADFLFGTQVTAAQWGMPGTFGARSPGVLSGLAVTPSFGLSVNVTPGVAYDVSSPSRRIDLQTSVVLDCSVDAVGNSTRPATGLSRQLGIFVHQARVEYDPQLQADGSVANFRSDEGAAVELWQSADYDPTRGQNPGPFNIPDDNGARLLLATLVIASTTTQIGPAAIQIASAQRPAIGQFGIEGDLPLSLKDAMCLVAGKTYGNLEVVPLAPSGPNQWVFVTPGWAVFGSQVVRVDGLSLPLTPPNNGERTVTLLVLRNDGSIETARAVSTQGAPTTPVVPGAMPLAEVRWDYDGPYGTAGFSPSDVLDDRPFLSGAVQVSRSRSRLVATAGQTVFDLTQGTGGQFFRYVPNFNTLQVFVTPTNAKGLGSLLDSTLYVETDPTHVTLTAPANAGDVYTFFSTLFNGH
jgi:hypothetical protein